jgi:hypothetical protein
MYVKLVPWLAVGTRRDRHGGRTGISDDLHKIATVINIYSNYLQNIQHG